MIHSDRPELRESESASGARLDSWKAIAAHLKRDVRTVQRWERSEGLPVHRHLHVRQGSIYAYAPELDAWWTGRQSRLEREAVSGTPGASERPANNAVFVRSALAAVAIVGGLFFIMWPKSPARQAVRFTVEAPPGTRLSRFPAPAISPDGRRLVFVATSAVGKDSLWVRQLDAVTVNELAGTDGGLFPFWAPDSRSVAFFAQGKLKIADVAGGPTQVVCDSPGFYGGTWSRGGVILFAPTHSGIFRVPAAGGTPTAVTTVDGAAGEIQHMWPEFLPDGRQFLYLANNSPGRPRSVRLGSLDGTETRLVLQNSSHAVFVAPDRLLFLRDQSLVLQRVDPVTVRPLGDPVTIANDVGVRQPIGRGAFSASQHGALVYRTAERILSQPTMFDRAGRRLTAFEPPADHDQPRFSPDEGKVAVGVANAGGMDRTIWLLDARAGQASRLNLGATGSGPVWSPDGKMVAFTGRRTGPGDLYRRPATSDAEEELLLQSPHWKIVTDWSADGERLIYQQQDATTQWDLWALPLSGERVAAPILREASNEQHGRLSSDGRWLAYASDASGRFEVYVRRFPPSAAHWKISTNGGMQPEWRRDGRELFYVSGDQRLVAVPVETGERLQVGPAQALFALDSEGVLTTPGTFHYSAAADGKRFLVNTVVNRVTPALTVVLNWQDELKRRLPTQ